MKRFPHYVKENYASETLTSCIFVDTETKERKKKDGHTGHVLKFGYAAYTRRTPKSGWSKPQWKRFEKYEDFWLWAMTFTRKKAKTWVWCLNSSFDFPVLHAFTHLPDTGWELESAIIDAPPTVVKYTMETRTLCLADVLNIFRMSARELGKKVGLQKLDMPKGKVSQEDWDTYCKRDVEIIMKAITEWADFLVRHDLGCFSPTIASQAMRAYRHRFMTHDILIDANDLSLKLARNCYHGGRCEAGYIGKMEKPVHSLDVNSMYPHVMATCEMPIRLLNMSRYVTVRNLPSLLNRFCVTAHVSIDCDEAFAPIVHEGKLIFPVGQFNAYLTTPELEYAVQRGFIRSIHLAACYEKAVAFRQFALDLYQHKESASREGRDIEARHFKLLLNSFYGKWGQSGRHWKPVGTCDRHRFERHIHIEAQTKIERVQRLFGGLVLERADEAESGESHPAIAAHVCAHARMILWALIRKLPPKNYLYCDTDGLLVLDEGVDALREHIDDYKLGFLKRVKTYSSVQIYGCKDLILDGKATLKGIRYDAEKLTESQFRQLKWSSLRGLLGSRSIDMPLTIPIIKTLRRTYTKGSIGADGFVSPLHWPLSC